MKLTELKDQVALNNSHRVVLTLGKIEINDDGTRLSWGNHAGTKEIILDDHGTALLARYLKVPNTYLKNLPTAERVRTLRYHRDRFSEADTVLQIVNDELVAIYSTEAMMLPLSRVLDEIEELPLPEAAVHEVIRETNLFQVDVTSPYLSIEVPNPLQVKGRPEPDIVYGGVRIVTYPFKNKAPSVVTYMHRVHTGSGMSTSLKAGEISFKGRTIEEVLLALRNNASAVIEGADEKLRLLAESGGIEVPGTPLAFATQLAREEGLKVGVRDVVTMLVTQLPPVASVFDVNEAFLQAAQRGVNYQTRLKLEQFGARLAIQAKRAVERCNTCEQLLVA
jgi:hypothetical protein